jgi:NAD(P)-dependent dehydrogenase (short-subunit alcohol dehydrogenase family)
VKTWFVTGASSGLGREWASAALERGDRVAAAARRGDKLQELADAHGDAVLPIELDVKDRAAVFAAVQQAHEHFGRLDVVVNGAGHGHYGSVEELTEAEARGIMDTNFFGALWVTQAVLPILRAQGGGHIVQVSSVGGHFAGPMLGIYHATKWALEGLSQSLAAEVKEFGIKVTILEPTGYKTPAEAAAAESDRIPGYEANWERLAERRTMVQGRAGDPAATPAALLQVVDAEDPPLRLLLGYGTVAFVTGEYESRIALWREWEPVSTAAHGWVPPPVG